MEISEKKIIPNQPLSEEEKELLSKVNEKDILVNLRDLVKYNSITYDPETYSDQSPIFEFTKNFFEKLGIDTKTYNSIHQDGDLEKKWPNLIAKIRGIEAKGKVLQFMGHLDIVPFNKDQWNKNPNPLDIKISDEKIYGRGVMDMKGGDACILTAFSILKKSGINFPNTIQAWFVPDEEIDGNYGAQFMIKDHFDVVNTDATLIAEPSGMAPIISPTIIIGEKGKVWLKLTFFGAAGHGSMPKKKSNAINKANRFISNIKKWKPPKPTKVLSVIEFVKGLFSRFTLSNLIKVLNSEDPENEPNPLDEDGPPISSLFNTSISFTQIHAGTKINVIPDTCELQMDIRVLPHIPIVDLIKSITKYSNKLGFKIQLPEAINDKVKNKKKIQQRPIDIKLEIITAQEGTAESRNKEFCKIVSDSFESIYETSAFYMLYPGATDAVHLRSSGIKNTFVVGPSGENAHSSDEFVYIKDLINCTKLYLLIAYRFLNN